MTVSPTHRESSAGELDVSDPLREFRREFHIPLDPAGQEQVYLTGNSLGLQPRLTAAYVFEELEAWRRLGVRGHSAGEHPWLPYHELLTGPMARLVGARDEEVVMMNSLTANLHLMLATFFRPQGKRRKILIEGQAFPSDHIAVESQLRWHRLDPREDLIVLSDDQTLPGAPRGVFDMARIAELMERHRDELALVLLPGVQYYTGQVFDIAGLTRVARENDVVIGWDLAHAAGNLALQLHDWEPDFAVWCSYKYLNSGPGSVGGCFVHARHVGKTDLPRLAGWWGHCKHTRFMMRNEFHAIPTAEGWQLSNPPILSLAAIRASLEVFTRAGGMGPLVAKSALMGQLFADQIERQLSGKLRILTPAPRGCQFSLQVVKPGAAARAVKQGLDAAGIESDWREPDVIRAAPVPLYNQFGEIERFVDKLAELLTV